nr:MSMEG_1061 family FMN-dependent PPOX-type flavoprotein [Vallicoccus soli]
MQPWTEVTDGAELARLLGEPLPAARDKPRATLHPYAAEWVRRSPFLLLATADAAGRCDVSPRGDPPGSVLVLDERTLALPERPGNRRADSLRNVLENPRAALLVLVPGRGDTLRVAGRARVVREAPFLDAMVVRGHRPPLALVLEVEEVFFHCSKAFLRSSLWDPATWDPGALPSRARIAQALERPGESLEELERYYGPSYGDRIYG